MFWLLPDENSDKAHTHNMLVSSLSATHFTDMTAIYQAFNEHEIACQDLTVQDSGCANVPVDPPVVSTITGNNRVRLEWQAVNNAQGYEVLRSDGGVFGCEQGKLLLTRSTSETTTTANLFFEDTGLQNGREVSEVVLLPWLKINSYSLTFQYMRLHCSIATLWCRKVSQQAATAQLRHPLLRHHFQVLIFASIALHRNSLSSRTLLGLKQLPVHSNLFRVMMGP